MHKILAIIPARSGSKTLIDKNIKLINGKPMIAYSIEHAIGSKFINRVIVSTDSNKYGEIAKTYGAEVPFLRPKEISLDNTLDIEVFEHVLNYLQIKENYLPDIVVHLRPTCPIRDIEDIDKMIQIMLDNDFVDSIRSIISVKEIPYKMWREKNNGTIEPILNDIHESYNMPRQILPKIYYQNACIDIIRTSTITQSHSMTGKNIIGYKMDYNYDIDNIEQFLIAEEYLKLLYNKNTFVFDIDGVIAKIREDLNYELAEPNNKMILIINKLFEKGNKIILFTARGYKTGKKWESITKNQLVKWGLKYHELRFGKPDADFYIDDKMLGVEKLFNLFNNFKN